MTTVNVKKKSLPWEGDTPLPTTLPTPSSLTPLARAQSLRSISLRPLFTEFLDPPLVFNHLSNKDRSE